VLMGWAHSGGTHRLRSLRLLIFATGPAGKAADLHGDDAREAVGAIGGRGGRMVTSARRLVVALGNMSVKLIRKQVGPYWYGSSICKRPQRSVLPIAARAPLRVCTDYRWQWNMCNLALREMAVCSCTIMKDVVWCERAGVESTGGSKVSSAKTCI
jgi:hypothetical protein